MKVKYTYEWYDFYSEYNPSKTKIEIYEDWTNEQFLALANERILSLEEGDEVSVYIDENTHSKVIELSYDYGEHIHTYQIIPE